MTLPWILLSILSLGNATLLAFLWWQLQHNQGAIHQLNASLAALRSRISEHQLDMEELRERKRVMEQLVDNSTSSVETVHRSIADTTFGVLGRLSENSLYKAGTDQLRQIHDGTSKGVYGTIRIANRELHSLADILIKQQQRKDDEDNSS
ncbi:MAG: hypothetical protein R3296_08820 [Oleiphilaceae bacterium]|nr:hypothetical protein [Oleiphilaceae bacterium]